MCDILDMITIIKQEELETIGKIKSNSLIQGDCLQVMKDIEDKSIDMIITSPPYDQMRIYTNETRWDFKIFKVIANEIYRIIKDGGVVVWIVNDQTIKGSESGTSFRQALYFKDIGFNLETMIWEKTGSGCLGSNKFYAQNFEYMFILSKGYPKTINLIHDRENVKKDGFVSTSGNIKANGSKTYRKIKRKPYGKRTNIWRITQQQKINHPAPFPEQLVCDHIKTWSNKNDIILDPFAGSFTTCIVCVKLRRNFIGIEISEKYCKIGLDRLHACGVTPQYINWDIQNYYILSNILGVI